MGDLSLHFSRHEFECKCGCGMDTVDYFLLILLERVRATFNRRVFIHSGNRCENYNWKKGGSFKSKHMISKAADIEVEDVPSPEVADFLESQLPRCCGIGRYASITHIDTRDNPVRWNG